MAVNERTDDRRRDTYYVGDVAGVPGDGHLWVDSQNANRIQIFRNGSWVTPRFDGITLTGTTTVTTLNATDLTVASATTTVALKAATGAARADGFIALGTAAVPTTATSTSGLVQISLLPGTPIGQTGVPTTGTGFLTYDTIGRALAVNVAGSWFRVASLTLY